MTVDAMKVALTSILLICGLVVSADTDLSELHYPIESRRAALVYGNSIEMSDSLVKQVDHELWLIRSHEFGQVVNQSFALPWRVGEIYIEIDSAYVETFLTERDESWQMLSHKYNLQAKPLERSTAHIGCSALSITLPNRSILTY